MRTLPCLVLALVCIVLQSCEKDSTTPSKPDNYYPLAIGNYWIYEWYKVEQDGTEALFGKIDTVRVIGDTTLNGEQYFVQDYMNLGMHHLRIVRDSSGYLIDHRGRKLFSAQAEADTLHKGTNEYDILRTYYIMEEDPYMVSVPAGDFETRVARGYSVLELTQNPDNPRYSDSHYAQDVGNVLHTAYYLSHANILEARLVEYNVK